MPPEKRKSDSALQRRDRTKTKSDISEIVLAGIGQKVKLRVHAKVSRKPRLITLPNGEASAIVYARSSSNDRAYLWAFLIHSYQLQNIILELAIDEIAEVTGVLVVGDGIHNTLNVETLERVALDTPLVSLPAWHVLR
ncbi:hypothetical protein [Beijerinckia mobilis]|uniref:hypothetical protein n=1 Tax=Beijerinckia mobilis TaxID=231434 RepID=UPI00055193E7|nr:hypothetical protein [Beijerinckia mobilis]